MTFSVDEKICRCVALLEENLLLAKLNYGDMIAIEAKYHLTGLVSLYRSLRQNSGLWNEQYFNVHQL